MSWAETYKINEDMRVPLNQMIWIQDYKLYGQGSYVFQDKDILHKLYRSRIAANDNSIKDEALTYANSVGNLELVVQNVYGISSGIAALFRGKVMQDVVGNRSTLNVIAQNEQLMLLFEGNAAFQAAAAESPLVESVTAPAVYGNGRQTVTNAYVISVDSGYAYYRETNKNYGAYGPGSYVLHGKDSDFVYRKAVTAIVNQKNLLLKPNVFVRSLQNDCINDSSRDGNGSNRVINYIQLAAVS